MRHKVAALALASIALAVAVSFGMSPPAHALAADCFGKKTTVQGTSGNDDIYVSASEVGVFVRINGREYEMLEYPSIVSGRGNDRVFFASDGGGRAVICTGDGDDVVTGNMAGRISTGSGKDRVEQYLMCSTNPDIYGAETVKITGFDSEEEGPCN